MKHYIEIFLKMLWAHAKSQIMALILAPTVFLMILSSRTGQYIMSIAFSIMYGIFIYSDAYNIAKSDIKSYSQHKPYIAKGIVMVLPLLAVTAVLLWFYNYSYTHVFADYDTQMKVSLAAKLMFRGWNFVFDGFRAAADLSISYFYTALIFMFMPLFSFLGYWAGINKYEFGYKFFNGLVYKKEKK